MAREIDRLSPRTVATTTRRGRHADGHGLYLQVSAFDTKAWIFATRSMASPTKWVWARCGLCCKIRLFGDVSV